MYNDPSGIKEINKRYDIYETFEKIYNRYNVEKIEFDYIGRFENLNEDLVDILLKLGVEKIKHSSQIKNNLTINSSKNKNKYTS